MSISLTPQWTAALPMVGVAILGLLSLAIVVTLAALDRWQDEQLARLNGLTRGSIAEADTATVAVAVVEQGEGDRI